MAPEISENLLPIYGDKIRDHDNVKDRKPVAGMADTSWIYSHGHLDQRDQYMSSYNVGEADMVAGLYLYLLQNGIEWNKITVLTFYKAQRKVLLHKIQAKCRGECVLSSRAVAFRPEEHLPNVRTVDSYQGEENDVILLSLVRSTSSNSIGFAGIDNRICVAISRARYGFYIFGNMSLFSARSETWHEIVHIMREKGGIGQDELRIRCSNHRTMSTINIAEDWEKYNGGCLKLCGERLTCGHECPAKCHP